MEDESPFSENRPDALHPFGESPRKYFGKHLAWAKIRPILTRMQWSFDSELVSKSIEWEKRKVYPFIEREPLIIRSSEQKD